MSEVARSSDDKASPSVPEQNSQGHVDDGVGASEEAKETVKKKLVGKLKHVRLLQMGRPKGTRRKVADTPLA
jgi:hypothetical protein